MLVEELADAGGAGVVEFVVGLSCARLRGLGDASGDRLRSDAVEDGFELLFGGETRVEKTAKGESFFGEFFLETSVEAGEDLKRD